MSAASGVKVAIRPVAASSTTDAAVTGVKAGPIKVKVVDVNVDGSIRKPEGTLKVALTLAFGHTPVAPTAGLVDITETFGGMGGVGGVMAQAPVAGTTVKVHAKSLSMVFAGLTRSFTPFAPPLIVTVYVTPAVSALAGVKVAIVPVAASRDTDAAITGVDAGVGPATTKVADVNVDGSKRAPEGTEKVALTVALGHTFTAALAGEKESTETFDGPPGTGGITGPALVNVHM